MGWCACDMCALFACVCLYVLFVVAFMCVSCVLCYMMCLFVCFVCVCVCVCVFYSVYQFVSSREYCCCSVRGVCFVCFVCVYVLCPCLRLYVSMSALICFYVCAKTVTTFDLSYRSRTCGTHTRVYVCVRLIRLRCLNPGKKGYNIFYENADQKTTVLFPSQPC